MAKILLDSKAFKHNLNAISNAIKSSTSHISNASSTTNTKIPSLALVMKDNAYGHGLLQIASLAKDNGIDCVFVKNYAEALQVRDFFPHITALYGGVPFGAPSNIYASIASLECLKQLQKDAQTYKNPTLPLGIELKCNIGMNRNGIQTEELNESFKILARLIAQNKVRLIGVFAHNGYGDNNGALEFYKSQATFCEIKQQVANFCKEQKIAMPRFHSLSTTGALQCALQANAQYNFYPQGESQLCDSIVRIGIGAYGYHTAEMPLDIALKPVASLWASKISTRNLKKGEKIGYGGATVVAKKSIFSTYDVGYGDGLFRLGRDMPKLHCASGEEILPVMSMDCFSCNSDKEEICVFSDVSEFARVFNTIPYTILTHLSPFIPRVIV